MPVLIAPETCEAPDVAKAKSPMLRVTRRGSGSDRVVALSPGKVAIGSSAQCQLRLPDAGVRPLQCLLTLQSGAADVTRWAAGALLNGKDFTKARLGDGDRLTVGEWDLTYFGSGASLGETCQEREPAAQQAPESHPSPRQSETREPPLLAPPPVAAPKANVVAVGPQPVSSATRAAVAESATCQQFGDRLLLHLWRSNHQARRRIKALINGVRAARFNAEAASADLAAMATELDLARAAYDSHAADEERLQREIAEERRQSEARTAPLLEEVVSLRRELAEAESNLSRATAELNGAMQLLHSDDSPATAEEAARRAELEQALAEHTSQIERLTDEMTALEKEKSRLATLYRDEVERTAGLKQALAARAAPEETFLLDSSGDAADAIGKSERLATSESSASQPTRRFEAHQHVPEQPISRVEKPAAPATASHANVLTDPKPQGSVKPSWAVEASSAPFDSGSATSFIDKYRHLLENDGEGQSPTTVGSSGSKPSRKSLLDDEYLSPAKVETSPKPTDDSDEALEAYMASMMHRVRGNVPVRISEPPALIATPTAAVPTQVESKAEDTSVDEQPFDFETMMQVTRKSPLASDLAALREIANNSARKAIATHSKRQSRESAVSRIVVALMATLSAAYLMHTAPAVTDWMFWAGATAGAVGITAALQVIRLERRIKAERELHAPH